MAVSQRMCGLLPLDGLRNLAAPGGFGKAYGLTRR
jgi:hypothetical protein